MSAYGNMPVAKVQGDDNYRFTGWFTQQVYTHFEIETLLEAIDKI